MLPRGELRAGDVLIGVASNGPHTNGYSLLRKLFDWLPMDSTPPGFDRPLGEALLVPHRSYLTCSTTALAGGQVKALAHITGGGLPENLPRVLPDDLRRRDRARLVAGAAAVPTGARGRHRLDTHELYRTLNMGIGMVVVCSPSPDDRRSAAPSTNRLGHRRARRRQPAATSSGSQAAR